MCRSSAKVLINVRCRQQLKIGHNLTTQIFRRCKICYFETKTETIDFVDNFSGTKIVNANLRVFLNPEFYSILGIFGKSDIDLQVKIKNFAIFF